MGGEGRNNSPEQLLATMGEPVFARETQYNFLTSIFAKVIIDLVDIVSKHGSIKLSLIIVVCVSFRAHY